MKRALPAVLLATCLYGAGALAAEPVPPNILWITCEDASPTLGCYGDSYAKTPHLDRLAEEGVRYNCCYSHAGVCAPSRSGLITGMYPSSLGSHPMRSEAMLPKDVRTFTAWLRDAGYYCTNNVKTDYNFAAPKDAWDDCSRRAHWRHRRPGQPFFSVFNHIGTHESRIRAPFDRTDHDPARAVLPPYLPDSPPVRRDWARYHDLVTEMDREAGRLIAQLEEDGLADDTIVFFFSDHGVGLPRAKQWIYEAGLHVPLIVRTPERFKELAHGRPGTTVDWLASFVDFGPTVLSLAGVPVPKVMQGRAFLGSQASEPRQYVYGVRDRMDERYDMQRTVRDRRYKYFRNYMPHLPYAPWLDYMEKLPTMQEWRRLAAEGSLSAEAALFMRPSKPIEELYDLEVDPHELHNLANSASHWEILLRMRTAHLAWVRETRDLGLLPEQQMHDRAAGRPHFDMARDRELFPVERILQAALLVGRQADALPAMIASLDDDDPAVRFWGCVALLNLGPDATSGEDALRKSLADASPEVRIMAADALCRRCEDAAALAALVDALDHASAWVRLRAANALDALGERARPALPVMRRLANDESPDNRYIAWTLKQALKTLEAGPKAQPNVAAAAAPAGELVDVGVARIDITPTRPIRLSGYATRLQPSEGVAQRLWAKAVAFGGDEQKPAVFVVADLVGVPASIADEVAARLARNTRVDRSRLAICATHTHTGPVVKGMLPFIFGADVPPEHQAVIDEYARELADKLERVAREALAPRRPGRIGCNRGSVTFASNRRKLADGRWIGFGTNPDGPIDHALPLLRIAEPDGKLRAVLLTYACHCTTFGGDFNQIHGDWAGCAQEQIETAHPGVTALVSIGCGADSNPNPRGGLAEAVRHGRAIAEEVDRLLALPARSICSPPECRFRRLDLPLAKIPDRSHWERLAQARGRDAYYARIVLERLNRGEQPANSFPYPVQTWTFGEDLLMVFLAGEVVVDYSLRLNSLFDPQKLWITAYANDAPCYIASRRVIVEGGYEVDKSMSSNDKPAPLSLEAEDRLVDAVRDLTPKAFASPRPIPPGENKPSPPPAKDALNELPPPLSPQESLAKIKLRGGMQVELVAAEPLVADPIDIAWGPDGRLWAVEMGDYPLGVGESGKSGGRVRFLEDLDGDGRYDRSTLFLDGLNFPTSVAPWRNGVLIAAAPDILFAEDLDGDGRADRCRPLYAGFGEGNQQHRVNGLQWGLDNWIHVANGDSDGVVRSLKTGGSVDIRGRDLSIRPDEGLLRAETGRAQYGRSQDDWGNWFGCNNSNPLWHYVLDDNYLRRNPHSAAPKGTVPVPAIAGAARVYPVSRTLARFNDLARADHFTSACGAMIYRDELLGPEFAGNAFVCEPVHNLVHREIVSPLGFTFRSRRADDEQHSEFFASADNWCRPTSVRSGPDGSLWIVDMYRLVIEHPKWIPSQQLERLDLRAGHDKGRIYRVFPAGQRPRPVPRLDRLNSLELVAALDSPNGWQRDMAQQMLVWRADLSAIEPLKRLLAESTRPQARLHALSTLDGLQAVDETLLLKCLADEHPAIRRHAIRLSEPLLNVNVRLAAAVAARAADSDAQVQLQLAYSLGEWRDPRSGELLMELLRSRPGDPYLLASALSSLHGDNLDAAASHLSRSIETDALAQQLCRELLPAAVSMCSSERTGRLLSPVLGLPGRRLETWQIAALAGVFDHFQNRSDELLAKLDRTAKARLESAFGDARRTAQDPAASESDRLAALPLLCREPAHSADDLALLTGLLSSKNSPALQQATVGALSRLSQLETPDLLLADFASHAPSLRAQILSLLLGRVTWTQALLDRLERSQFSAAQLDAGQRQLLLEHKNAQIRLRAAALLRDTTNADRAQVVEDYQIAAGLPGDLARGRDVFRRRCAVCHRLEAVGNDVGPDLRSLKDRSAKAIVIALLDPNRAVETRYSLYTAVTLDGRLFTGLLKSESGTSITLQGQEGKEQTILRRDLEDLQSSGKSLMPEGLEKELAPQDVADIVRYLATVDMPGRRGPAGVE